MYLVSKIYKMRVIQSHTRTPKFIENSLIILFVALSVTDAQLQEEQVIKLSRFI